MLEFNIISNSNAVIINYYYYYYHYPFQPDHWDIRHYKEFLMFGFNILSNNNVVIINYYQMQLKINETQLGRPVSDSFSYYINKEEGLRGFFVFPLFSICALSLSLVSGPSLSWSSSDKLSLVSVSSPVHFYSYTSFSCFVLKIYPESSHCLINSQVDDKFLRVIPFLKAAG